MEHSLGRAPTEHTQMAGTQNLCHSLSRATHYTEPLSSYCLVGCRRATLSAQWVRAGGVRKGTVRVCTFIRTRAQLCGGTSTEELLTSLHR